MSSYTSGNGPTGFRPEVIIERAPARRYVMSTLRPSLYAQLSSALGPPPEAPCFAASETSGVDTGAVENEVGTEQIGQYTTHKPDSIKDVALSAAIETCVQFPAKAFFQSRRAARSELLKPAYELMLKLSEEGFPAIDLAIAALPTGLRERRPSRHKIELLAVELTAKPENTEQRKACSKYAAILQVARHKNIAVDDFTSWSDEVNIEDCQTAAKEIRKGASENGGVGKLGALPLDQADSATSTGAATPQPAHSSPALDLGELHTDGRAQDPNDAWMEVGCGIGPHGSSTSRVPIPASLKDEIAGLLRSGLRIDEVPPFLRLIADAVENGTRTPGNSTA